MNRLKELRKEKKLTQKALAEKLKIPYRTIQNWENEEVQIKPDNAEKLANFFDVPVGYLLGFNIDDVSEKQIINHNEIMDGLKKMSYIKLLDFFVLSFIPISDKQFFSLYSQIEAMREINEEYVSLKDGDNKTRDDFSLFYNYVPDEKIIRGDDRLYYDSEFTDKQYKLFKKILFDKDN